MAGLGNKDNEFWGKLGEWKIMFLLEKKRWEKIKSRLPKGYEWHRQNAVRKNKKGKAIGGILMGVKKRLAIEEKISVGERVIKLRVRMKNEMETGRNIRTRECGRETNKGLDEDRGKGEKSNNWRRFKHKDGRTTRKGMGRE